jgi:hypothetical protein
MVEKFVTKKIVYSPDNEYVDRVLLDLKNLLGDFLEVYSVDNSVDLQTELIATKAYVGIEFPDNYKVGLEPGSIIKLIPCVCAF